MVDKKKKKVKEESVVETMQETIEDITDTVEESVKELKTFFKSRTVWVNIIAFVAFLVQHKFGYVMDESVQMQLLTLVNIALRAMTKEPIVWKQEEKKNDGTTESNTATDK